jgi:methionyl aminopeptidase
MTIETEKDFEGLQRVGRIVGLTLQEMGKSLRPGMSTLELDEIGARFMEKQGARSAPQMTYDFPGATCISINEEVAHGVPGERLIAPGDLVNVDVSAELDGYVADTGGTFIVPPATADKLKLCHAARLALRDAMIQAVAGRAINEIGRAVQRVAKQKGLKVIKNLGSHGVGRHLHEEPRFIAGYYDPTDRRRLWDGLVITIEPFLSTRTDFVEEGDNGWTLSGPRGCLAAQYEHTVIITRGQPIPVTAVAG